MSAVLEVENVSKTFTRTKALSGVSMTIEPGEVHALLGQNGSGKSTLIKILSGYHAPDPGGGIRVEGQDLPLQSPVQSYRLGCRFVQQDLGLVSTLSVLDNMALGSGFPTRSERFNGKATYKQAKGDLERLSLDIDPRALVATLSASERTGRGHRARAARGSRNTRRACSCSTSRRRRFPSMRSTICSTESARWRPPASACCT